MRQCSAKGDNFSAWADFKEWMDVSFSEALFMGRKAIEEVDPEAYVNIGGGQRPGWGGYDYARITKALTAIEPYDIGNNVEIIRSLNPAMADGVHWVCKWSVGAAACLERTLSWSSRANHLGREARVC